MICHHPGDDLLLSLAAGHLPAASALVVQAHAERCTQCQSRLRTLECVGGVLLDEMEPATLSSQALARTLAVIDAPPERTAPLKSRSSRSERPSLPAGMTWPRALEDCMATPWRWLAPGMRWSRLKLPNSPDARLFLLRIGAGRSLATHTHSDTELTQVLYGSFHDGRDQFCAGDFDAADPTVHHQPTVKTESECICLASIEGRMRFDNPLARAMASLIGM